MAHVTPLVSLTIIANAEYRGVRIEAGQNRIAYEWHAELVTVTE
jgi:hypothetical protein